MQLLWASLLWCAAAVQVRRSLDELRWDTQEAARQSCQALAAKTAQGAGIVVTAETRSAQDELVRNGHHVRVMKAMRDYPDGLGLHRACSAVLGNAAQWNRANAEALGADGVMETLVASLKRFPKEQFPVLGQLGSFCDFVDENRVRLRKAGGLEVAFKVAEDVNSSDAHGVLMCLVSTQVSPPENLRKMIDLGLVHRLVQGMKDFPTATTVRGESIWDALLMQRSSDVSLIPELVKEGFLGEMVKAMRDEPAMHARGISFDPMGMGGSEKGMLRMYTSAFSILGMIAGAGAPYADAARTSGVVEETVKVLQTVGHLEGDFPWGDHMSIVGSACPALAAMAGSHGGPQAQLAQAQDSVRKVLSNESLASAGQQACHNFLAMKL